MKKLIALILVLLVCLLVVVNINPTVRYLSTDGDVVPASADVAQALSNTTSDAIYLQSMQADSMIYSSFFQDYDYETKVAIDMGFPMYTNGGATLYFMSDEFWLITDEFDLLTSYENLYLTDGNTYNSDLSLADGAEFLLISVADGLYMNAQTTVFTNVLGETVIPANSIISFDDSYVRYFSYSDGALIYASVDQVFDASITIGEHTYNYADFLVALGLFQEAKDSIEKQSDIKEVQDAIAEILEEEESDTTQGTAAQGTGSSASDGDADAEGLADGSALDADGTQDDAQEGDGAQDGDGADDESLDATDDEAGEEKDSDTEEEENDSASSDDDDEEDSSDASTDTSGNTDADMGNSGSDGDTADGDGDSPEAAYQVPTVSISDLDAWAYAISGELSIFDPSATIRKGVSLAVYSKISGSGTVTTVDGGNVYSADDYTGGSAKLRKTLYSSQSFTLDGIEPGQSFYLQYSYSYNALVIDEETGEEVYTALTVLSDLYEISTENFDESDIPTILLSYDTGFAAASTGFVFENFYLENDNAYDAEDSSFANFKLNVLPYISSITIDFTSNDDTDVTIASSKLKSAMLEGGMLYESSSKLLSSNSEHTYTITATDKYGNELAIKVNDDAQNTSSYEASGTSGTFLGVIYTAKQQPTVTIEEVSNVTDYLTLQLTVSDPDGALSNSALSVSAVDTSGILASLSGTWGACSGLANENTSLSGTSFTSDTGNILTLPDAQDGAVYTIVVDSLGFARTYTFTATGDYTPQPDSSSATDTLAEQKSVTFGSAKFYTAAMTNGIIQVDVTLSDSLILDTSATTSFRITSDSTIQVLALVDEFQVTITDTDNSVERAVVVLQESVLSQTYLNTENDVGDIYSYNAETGSVILSSEYGVTVELVGDESVFTAVDLWSVLLATETAADADAGIAASTSSAAAQLRITMADGTLESSTAHTVGFKAVVLKSGIEYEIPVTMDESSFQTKKKTPVVTMEDAFIAGDTITFMGFDVTDVDGAVVGEGALELQLYVGSTLLQKVSFSVDDTAQDISFTGVTEGVLYDIKVVALQYNNDTGYTHYGTNVTIYTYEDVEAGSDIKATITLNSLDYSYSTYENDPVLSISGSYAAQAIAGTEDGTITGTYDKWTTYSTTQTNSYYTEYFRLDELGIDPTDGNTYAFELDYHPETTATVDTTMYSGMRIYFYEENSAGNPTSGTYVTVTYASGSNVVMEVPEDTVFVRFLVGDQDYLESYGFDVYCHTLDEDACLVDTNSGYYTTGTQVTEGFYITSATTAALTVESSYCTITDIPVTAGDIYYVGYGSTIYNSRIYYYNDQGQYVGYDSTLGSGYIFTIPENVAYISFSKTIANKVSIYKIESAAGAQYVLDADISVYDKNGALITTALDGSESSNIYLKVERADSLNVDVLGEDSYQEVSQEEAALLIAMVQNSEDGAYEGDLSYNGVLDPNCTYRLSVMADYNNTEITLATQTVQTDGALIMINNEGDLSKIVAYPYANFLVTADFEVSEYFDITFYGTIDFDGHTLTRVRETPTALISTLGVGGVIENLVYVVANGYIKPIVTSNYGTMENIIIETTGDVVNYPTTSTAANTSLLTYANYGTVNNFIIELGGNFIIGYNNVAIAVAENAGVIQNGYIYSLNGGALIVEDGVTSEAGGFTTNRTYDGTIENVYSVYDIYVSVNSDGSFDGTTIGFAIATYNDYSLNLSNIYHVGDFYQYTASSNGVEATLTERRIAYNTNVASSRMTEVWSVSLYDYAAYNTYDTSEVATISMLSDATWQSQVLTGNFKTTESVEMGYYPRLDMPTCMEQSQSYRSLPSTTQSTTPTILSDDYAEGTTAGNESSTITLRLENKNSYYISDITIDGLLCYIVSQGVAEDGFYDVTLSATVSSVDPEYLSAYTVTSLTYSNGGLTQTITPDYTTSNIAFYKSVSSAADWYAINDEMYWNYRLTNDINFASSTSLAGIMINGSTTELTKTTTFYGTIDGNGYTIKNISLENVDRPYVVYSMGSGATIENLYIESLTLSCKTTATTGYFTSFIRYAATNTTIENVHMTNVTIEGMYYMGALVGQSYAQITNCSVTNVDISIKSTISAVVIGGMVGQHVGYGNISNCYAKNVTITATGITTTNGIGGMIGYATNVASITDCYVQGDITSSVEKTGGFVGYINGSSYNLRNIVADVNIMSSQGYVGGVIAHNTTVRHSNILALGDIIASNTYVHRVIGLDDTTSYYYYPTYAYKYQMVNSLSSDDNDGAQYLFDTEDLMQEYAWVDSMSFGTQWDYSLVSEGYMPQLYYKDTDILLPGQGEDSAIPLPGTESLTAELITATTQSATGSSFTQYIVDVRITDEECTYTELVAKIESGEVTFVVDGMNMTEVDYVTSTSALASGKWTYTVSQDGDSDSVRVMIYTTEFLNAWDTYTLTVSDDMTTNTFVVDYGVSLYHTISNLAEWNTWIENGYGYSAENIEIAGVINFEGTVPQYTNLVIGNIKGTSADAGFTNIYTYGMVGNWIASCRSVSGVSFTNLTADYTSLTSLQTMCTFIGVMSGDFTDITISNITLKGTNQRAQTLALVYSITGNISNVNISNVTIESQQVNTDQRSYTGAITGYLTGSMSYITASNITIEVDEYRNYVGVLVGRMDGVYSEGNTMLNEYITVSDSSVNGRNYVGGVVGYMSDALPFQNVVIDNVTVEAQYNAGGIAAYASFANSGYHNINVTVMDSSVTTTIESTSSYYTGGVVGYCNTSAYWYDVLVENTVVTSTGRAGGFAGQDGSDKLIGIEIIGCTITQHSPESANMTTLGAGAIAGSESDGDSYVYDVVVRDTTVTADYNAGGIVGYLPNSYLLRVYNSYVAEDVVVTALRENAGGVFGMADEFYINDTAVGATVSAVGSKAGGVVGYLYNDFTTQKIDGVYVSGTVTAGDYAAGVIGYVEEGITLATTQLIGIIVTTDVSAATNVNPVINYGTPATSHESSNIGVWDNLLINGQTLQTLYCEADDADTSEKTALYAGVSMLSATGLAFADEDSGTAADDFLQLDTYAAYSFTTVTATTALPDQQPMIDCTYLVASGATEDQYSAAQISAIQSNAYMPFIATYDKTGEVLHNTQSYESIASVTMDTTAKTYTISYTTKDSSTGILRPTAGERTGVTVVYTSGANTLNIETINDSVTYTVGSGTAQPYTFTETGGEGEYNTLTIGYDFASDITVDGISYTSADFVRTVMTYGEYWYYIDASGNVMYGKAADDTPTAISGISNAVHLWQGKVITSSGTVYSLDGDVATQDTSTISLGTVQDSVVPLFASTSTDLYDIYYNYSLDANSNYYAYRAFVLSMDDTSYDLYPVFTAQSMLYDGYILSSVWMDVDGLTTEVVFRAMLSTETDTLTEYYVSTPIIATGDDFSAYEIAYMSNSYGYTGTVAVLYYQDGTVKVWDYTTGDVSTVVEPVASYSLLSGVNTVNGDNSTNGTSTFASMVSFASAYTTSLFTTNGVDTYGSDIPTDGSYSESAVTLASYSALTEDQAAADPDESDTATGASTSTQGSADAAGEGAAQTDDSATGGVDGASGTGDAADTDGASQGATGDDVDTLTTSGESNADGEGGAAATGTSSTSAADASTAQTDTTTGAATSIVDGTSTADGSASQDTVQGSASDTDGIAINISGTATTADGTVSVLDGTAVPLAAGQDAAYTIAYNPYTKSYEVYVTADLAANGTVSAQSQNSTIAAALQGDAQDIVLNPESDFAIRVQATTMLSSDERNGFVLLAIIALCGVAVVITLQLKYKKR